MRIENIFFDILMPFIKLKLIFSEYKINIFNIIYYNKVEFINF